VNVKDLQLLWEVYRLEPDSHDCIIDIGYCPSFDAWLEGMGYMDIGHVVTFKGGKWKVLRRAERTSII